MLKRDEARRLYNIAKEYYKDEMTHFIIADDHWSKFYITRVVLKGQTVEEIKKNIKSLGTGVSIIAIFNCDLPFEEQLREDYPMHDEPSKEFKTNYEKALEYATKKHEGQFRKGETIAKKYIEHPIAVSKLVENYLKNDPKIETYKIVALLHDTLEDTNATYEEEKELFGKDVVDMVQTLTNDDNEIEKVGKDVYLGNKLINMNDDVLTIKLCDRLDNIKDLKISGPNFRMKYMQETMYIINFLMTNRKLTPTHLKIINDIMLEIKKVANKSKIDYKLNKIILIYEQ